MYEYLLVSVANGKVQLTIELLLTLKLENTIGVDSVEIAWLEPATGCLNQIENPIWFLVVFAGTAACIEYAVPAVKAAHDI